MAGVGALLDFDDEPSSSVISDFGRNHDARGLDPFGATDFLDDFNTGSNQSHTGKIDPFYSDDFDPFFKSNGSTNNTEYYSEITTQNEVHEHDQYGDLLGDFGSNGLNHNTAESANYNNDDHHHHIASTGIEVNEGTNDDEDNNGLQYTTHDEYTEESSVERRSTFSWTPSTEKSTAERFNDSETEYQQSSAPRDQSVGSRPAAAARRSQSRERRQQEYSSRLVNDENACHQCGKRVYPMEMITADEIVYHKSCFRCTHCNRVLSLLNYSAIDGQMFCKPHFLEMFKMKGNYADGFKVGSRTLENGTGFENEDDQRRNASHSSSQWNESYVEDDVDHPPQDSKEEIPAVQLKQVRNIFENLAQNTPQQAGALPSSSSRSSRESRPTEKAIHHETTAYAARKETVDRERSRDSDDLDLADRDVVQCSSTVFVIEEELPPPAITRSILAKFRELESSNDSKAVPLPKTSTSSRRSSSKWTDSRSEEQHSHRSADVIGSESVYQNAADIRRQDEVDHRRTSVDSGSGRDYHTSDNSEQAAATADELPQRGLAKNLLARWRTIEQQASRGRDETLSAKRSSPARRSQSTSRVEVRQRSRVNRQDSDEEDNHRSRVADYLNVHNQLEQVEVDDNQPPSLMTREVLAKFRSMENQQKSAVSQQPPLQRQRDDVIVEKSFRWEVKEAIPLSRGNLVVHGDVPKRSGDADRPEVSASAASVDAAAELSAVHEDELPAPSTTRNLLSLFKSMEDHSAAPPTPERSEKMHSVVRSDSRSTRNQQPVRSPSNLEPDSPSRSNGIDFEVAADAGVFENQPVYDPSLIRESDRMDEAELPERGLTRGLLAKFQQMQQSN